MSVSKTASAAAKAVEKSQKKDGVERTPEIILADLRKNLATGLAVTPDDQRFLLAAYDAAIAEAKKLGVEAVELLKKLDEALGVNIDLQAKNDEFRRVYELENRSAVLVISKEDSEEISRVDYSKLPPGVVESVESVESE